MTLEQLKNQSSQVRVVRLTPLPLMESTDWSAQISYQLSETLCDEPLNRDSGDLRVFKNLESAYRYMRRHGVTAPILII